MLFLDAIALLSFVWILYYYLSTRLRSRLPLPPGPKKLPVVGNLLDMPKRLEWETYHAWCVEFESDIIHVDVAGTDVIVLDKYETAVDLLEKRSSIYSGRPRMPMVVELMGWEFNFAFMDYVIAIGNRWRLRRLMHHSFHPAAAAEFHPAARGLVRRVLDNPDDLLGELRHLSREVVPSTTYGLEIASKTDRYITLAKEGVDPVLPALVPGTYLVDVLPILKNVPEWLPGAGFKRKAKEWCRLALAMRDIPYTAAKQEIENGSARHSFCFSSLQSLKEGIEYEKHENDIRDAAGTLYGAGADSTMAAVANCILALLNHPDVLKKAHVEIDRVLKPRALPDLEDQELLPYITAVVKEGLRWKETVPLGKLIPLSEESISA
ncbi:hypothetical protein NLJ89_g10312 [Agrocybe chaxingu]|uniref:Cytochrome P450 n=1 Tax=Agrocybe chaxingu TaxID=84603 RepID=A0A9W8MR13_9AGAR|nr:hypothetical protein NLJ89_g10312 [Agrocybe chaxingu]